MKKAILSLALLASVSVHAEEVINFGSNLDALKQCLEFQTVLELKGSRKDISFGFWNYQYNNKFISVSCEPGLKEYKAVVRSEQEFSEMAKAYWQRLKAEKEIQSQQQQQLLRKYGL